jgi:hypothetical protein
MRKKIGTFAYFPVGTNTYTWLQSCPENACPIQPLIPEGVRGPVYRLPGRNPPGKEIFRRMFIDAMTTASAKNVRRINFAAGTAGNGESNDGRGLSPQRRADETGGTVKRPKA